ncbi:MAG: hypothetical protein Q7R48_01385 [bacterium]|nr:hypothetical protein [bacterium]
MKTKKKLVKKRAIPKKSKGQKQKGQKKEKPVRKAQGKLVGRVIHYYDKIKVAVIKFSAPVKKGDKVRFEGGETLFSQQLGSMEKDHTKIAKAGKGQEVGVRVAKQVREGYRVFK